MRAGAVAQGRSSLLRSSVLPTAAPSARDGNRVLVRGNALRQPSPWLTTCLGTTSGRLLKRFHSSVRDILPTVRPPATRLERMPGRQVRSRCERAQHTLRAPFFFWSDRQDVCGLAEPLSSCHRTARTCYGALLKSTATVSDWWSLRRRGGGRARPAQAVGRAQPRSLP